MLVLSAGMPKSGTAWYYNMTNDLLRIAKGYNAQSIRDRFQLDSILKGANCRLDSPTFLRLTRLSVPSLLQKSYVVKTHCRLNPAINFFTNTKLVKATFISRDPRDVVLSALDHGELARQKGKDLAFATLENVESSIESTCRWLTIWDSWTQCKNALTVRYEDLVANPVDELKRLVKFLQLDLPTETLESIADAYRPDSLRQNQTHRFHFNKGIVGRFREVMTEQEIELCNQRFQPYLTRMGYGD